MGESTEWMRKAACKGLPFSVMNPGKGGDQGPPKAICRSCPVQPQCYDWIMSIPKVADPGGIVAGMNERDRRRERARLRVRAASAPADDPNPT